MNTMNFNTSEIQELKRKFEEVDDDQNGTISRDELKKILQLEIPSDSVEKYLEFLDEVDTDNSSTINYSEFLSLVTSKKNLLQEENLKITFKTLDFDNNGSISIQDLKRAFSFGGNSRTDEFWVKFI